MVKEYGCGDGCVEALSLPGTGREAVLGGEMQCWEGSRGKSRGRRQLSRQHLRE